MDKSYSTPRDVGNASIDDVVRALNRVLRSVEGSTNFIYQSEFEYANGRKAPLLMVGALRGPWREYVRRHANSPGFAAGECEARKDAGGKIQLDLNANRGKGTGPSHARILNAGPLRRIGVEARFVGVLAGGGAAAADSESGSGPAAATAAGEPAAADAEALGKAILDGFAGFKARPTMESLGALTEQIARFRELAPSGTRLEQQVGQIGKVLETKGRAFVRSKGGDSE